MRALCFYFLLTSSSLWLFGQVDLITREEVLSNQVVWSIAQDQKGFIWFGTEDGLYRYDGYVFRVFKNDPENPSSLSDNFIYAITEDKKGMIWLGTNSKGLSRLDPGTNQFQTYGSDSGDPDYTGDERIFCITEGIEDVLWIGTFDKGLILFDRSDETFTSYFSDTDLPFGVRRIYDIIRTREKLWLLTGAGLVEWYPKEDRSNLYYPDKFSLSWNTNNLFNVEVDPSGNIWFGAIEGLVQFNVKSKTFSLFTPEKIIDIREIVDDDYSNRNRITRIIQNEDGTFWLGTFYGMILFDPTSENMELWRNPYPKNDQVWEEIISIFRGKNSVTWVGTHSRGVHKIFPAENNFIHNGPSQNPGKVRLDSTEVALEFTDFSIYGQSIQVGQEIENQVILLKDMAYTEEIVLPPNQHMFSIEFSGLNHVYPDKSIYAYKLEGFNDDWIQLERGIRTATFTNLDPGDYNFLVRVANYDGTWNKNVKSVFITISAPWWGTWTARIGMITMFVAAIYFFMEWRLKFNDQLNRKLSAVINEKTAEINHQNHQILEKNRALEALNQDLEENLQEKQNVLKKLEQAQGQLIESEKMASLGVLTAGLAHELNNPLNIIGGVVDPVKEDLNDLKAYLKGNEEALPLIDEIEELLDHVAEGAHKATQVIRNLMGISPRSQENQFSIIDVKEMISTTSLLIKKGNPNIEFGEDLESDMIIAGNPVEISQVLINMIRNSIDAIGERQKGIISIRGYRKNQDVIIEIVDNGEGIPAEMKLQIFDPFFTTKEPGKGTGLGLYLSMSIIKKHSGQILVESNPGKTKFSLIIPVYDPDR